MGQLIYLTHATLDGFIGDGDFSWATPDEEITAAINGILADVGTYLYGRRTYETMAVWDDDPSLAERSPESARFAATWQAAEKVVFSSTLERVHTRRTRLERRLDAQVVAGIAAASDGDLTIGGPMLGTEALRLDLVDVIEVLWHPVLLGAGLPVLTAGVRRHLRLREERRFGSGVVHATYEMAGRPAP